ncbi:MAG: adenine phosphoribosyltransferase [Spirochaetaceae bacterium]|nr:adenine phosphoribosyltransferase [Spirochaetaceae bacterium]MCB9892756.1 adenine phosphoribosyltransferase [Planctomycetota bacterium]
MTPLRSLIRTIPDHPKPGVQFRDITTLLRDPEGLRLSVEAIADRHRSTSRRSLGPVGGAEVDLVVGIEARGFIFGTAIAYRLGVGFVPLRKPGKLPGATVGRDFALEYGEDRIEMHVGAVETGSRVLLVDDLIATGGTASAAVELLRDAGAEIVECAFVIALPDLGGVERLERQGCSVFSLCDFAGD